MDTIPDVIDKFNAADGSIRATFPKVDPRLVVALVFDRNAKQQNIYTLEVILKPGQDTERMRQAVVYKTGASPGFYLSGTKMIVSHMLDLEFLMWINDRDEIVSIRGSRYGAGGATDF
jgi:aerobic-type carbon monoxide dehydrogenase small subunit (CoxS/CutS family)